VGISTATHQPAWVPLIREPQSPSHTQTRLVGVLRGEGIGPEVIGAALESLRLMEAAGGRRVAIEFGGSIGKAGEREAGTALPEDTLGFCEDVLARGGAILSGPGGGRYVYELRRRLGLFIKVSPIDCRLGLMEASPLRPELLDGVDILMVRENLGGIYQGSATVAAGADSGSVVEHHFSYAESDVRRFLVAAARLAAARRGELTVVVKQSGMPELAALWQAVAREVCREHDIEVSFIDVDLMAYRVVESPRAFDVVAAANLFGDILGDLAAVLLGARALSFGASYDDRGSGVYQTNHGAAHDIAGSGRANPLGQILSLAALLRESLDMCLEAWALEEGVLRTLNNGETTDDLGGPLGTDEVGARVGMAAAEVLRTQAG
jgi:3-isopropylmalate dehydrogenase